MYTRYEWSSSVLYLVGNINPLPSIVKWLASWTKFESVPGGAAYNLLNTTLKMPGSTDFNSVGVQNFVSYNQGVLANASTLLNGYYPNISKALRYNDISALTTPSAVIDDELQKWGTGRVQKNIINVMVENLTEQFQGTINMNVPEGWNDDGTTLTAPNGEKVTQGFRNWILNHNWDADNWPLSGEIGSSSIEDSNASIGSGTYQIFRKTRLEWTESRGVFEGWLGVEYEFVKQQRDALQQQINNDQVLIANLKSGLPKDMITKLLDDCQSMISKLNGLA